MTQAAKREVARAAPAKLNLSLRVTGRRADGYHELDSLIAFADFGDRITVAAAPELSLAIEGPFAGPLRDEPDNLVLRAARRLARHAGVPPQARIVLDKRLPVAAGLGGGSADAAATLAALVELWGLDLDAAAVRELALELGADVPICLHGCAAFVGGIGETIVPAPSLPPAWLVLVNPGTPLSTAAVFKAGPAIAGEAPPRWTDAPVDAAALARRLAASANDLEAPARRICPEINEVLARLGATPGALLARMSGSGATCFGLFAARETAERAAAALAAARADWWVRVAKLCG